MKLHTKLGFTIIEMLTVVAVLGLLIALLTPAVTMAIRSAEKKRTLAAVTSLVSVLNHYMHEYSRWPGTSQDAETSDTMVKMLLGQNMESVDYPNVRKIVFMEFPPKEIKAGKFTDPWGNTYKLRFDVDYDHQIPDPFGSGNIEADCIVWSLGSDGQAGTKDDICSWK